MIVVNSHHGGSKAASTEMLPLEGYSTKRRMIEAMRSSRPGRVQRPVLSLNMYRGASELCASQKKQTLARYLAIVGVLNVCLLVAWAGVVNVFNVNAASWPEDTQERSYLNNGLCGEGTTYACPGDHVSTPRPAESVHISPDGELVVPSGTDMFELEMTPLKRE